MSNKQNKTLAHTLLLISGIIFASASVVFFKEVHKKDAGKVLTEVKKHFASQGKIEGSWIDYEPIEYTSFESLPLVYVGGISRIEGSLLVQYQFACDVYTGDLIDVQHISSQPVTDYPF